MSTPILSLNQVSKRFGSLTAVNDLSLEVYEKEVLGIAGPNGAGKSTLFNLITKVPYGPDSGEIRFHGHDLHRANPRQIVRLGLARTWQTEATFGPLTVLESLRAVAVYGAGLRSSETARRSGEVMEQTGLTRLAACTSSDLPLFDKKRLMIATALITSPKLLMMDEPAAGLNASERGELEELIRQINATGVTVMIIEHVLPMLVAVAHRLAVLASGGLLAEGAPKATLALDRVVEAYIGKAVVS